ncbi:MAG: hypothetical protein QOC92_1210 [Acidimicrobiaceae bacterium]|jgi:hypothetical protein
MTSFIGLLSWDPEIRNMLSLGVGILVLVGSVILLLSTNTGPRTGMLIGLAGLLGWLMVMGLMWWMYGIGMKGTPSHWRVIDVNVGNLAAATLPQATRLPTPDETKVVAAILTAHPELEDKVNPEHTAGRITTIGELVEADPSVASEFHLTPDELAGWHMLVPSNPQRGDAQAIADAAIGPDGKKLFKDSSGYKILEAYDIGGKENEYPVPAHANCSFPNPFNTGCWHRVANMIATSIHTHPEHYAIVQVKAVIPQDTKAGEAPPQPIIDPNAPVISVVMIRSLGDLRFPGFMLFVVAGTLFAITCNTLHRRDKRMARNRAEVS